MLLKISTIIFLIVLFFVFHIVPGKFRGLVLLPASILFVYSEGGILVLGVLVLITLMAYVGGLLIGKKSVNEDGIGDTHRHRLMVIFVAVFVAVLACWKYIPWGLTRTGIISAEELASSERLSKVLAMPIGLSFYTFQAISYIVDVYTGRLKAPEKKILRFAIYMMWFPKWMSGPIERCSDFIRQLEMSARVRLFSPEYGYRLEKAVSFLVWGLFMKLVIADRIGIVVDTVYAEMGSCGFLTMMLVSILYTIQIYCDFAGYTNAMIGISGLFGIDLTQNFVTPYFSENTVEFWRRWHISLSGWLRDYLYIPLGGNRKGDARKRINTLIVFLVCGMWHGAGLCFIVWGLMHGLFNIATDLASKSKAAVLTKGALGRVLTFCLVSFAWIFFRANGIVEALTFVKGMIPGVNAAAPLAGLVVSESTMLGISVMEWWIAAVSMALLVILDVYAYRKKDVVPALVAGEWGVAARTVLLTVLIFVVLVFGKYGSGEEIRSFMYMQF